MSTNLVNVKDVRIEPGEVENVLREPGQGQL